MRAVAGLVETASPVHLPARAAACRCTWPHGKVHRAQKLARCAEAALLPAPPGRAVVDEVVPPRFLAEAVPQLDPDSLGLAVVQETGGSW